MSITSRHDNSATILLKVKTIVSNPVRFTRESTLFDMGMRAAFDKIADTIREMERQPNDTGSNT